MLSTYIDTSCLYKAQLDREISKLESKKKYEPVGNKEFFNIWIEVNECLSKKNYEQICSLISASEDVIQYAYTKVLKKNNITILSHRQRHILFQQGESLMSDKKFKNLEVH